MNPKKLFPDHIQQEMQASAEHFDGKTMPVYAEADRIRRMHNANVALEDYVEELIRIGNLRGIGFELDPSQAREAMRGSFAHCAENS